MRRAGVIVFLLGQSAVRGLVASPVTSAAAVATIGIALLLVGGFALLVSNMQGLLDRFGEELHVTAYLDTSLTESDERALAARAKGLAGVVGVGLVTRSQALDRFRESFNGIELLEGLDENPLPSSLEIELAESARTTEGLAEVSLRIEALSGVAELSHGQDWVEGYARVAGLVRLAAFGLGGVLALSALLIVANTIRLAIFARNDEIAILDLVGASPVYVRTPFLVEGLIQGALGGLVALGALFVVYRVALPRVQFGLEIFIGNLTPSFFSGGEAAWLVAAGAGLGALGSLAALVGWRT